MSIFVQCWRNFIGCQSIIDSCLRFMTFKAQAKLAPQYIQDLINDYTPQRNLRSDSKCLLKTPNYNLESYGKRAFSVAAPRLWNSLPMELKTSTLIDIFKKKLKTYLFKHSYFWHWTLFFLYVHIFNLGFNFICIFILSALIIVMDRYAI